MWHVLVPLSRGTSNTLPTVRVRLNASVACNNAIGQACVKCHTTWYLSNCVHFSLMLVPSMLPPLHQPKAIAEKGKTQTQNKSERGCGWAYPTLQCSIAVIYLIERTLMLFPSTKPNSTHPFGNRLRWNLLNFWIINVDT